MIVYEVKIDSHGNEYQTNKIAGSYRQYYGPNKPYNKYKGISMNVNETDLEFFKKYLNAKIENLEEFNLKYGFTLNYTKKDNTIIISGPGDFIHKEICFIEDFLKPIGLNYEKMLELYPN